MLWAPLPPPSPPPPAPPPLEYRVAVDLPLTLGLWAAWIGSEVAIGPLAPASCRFCEPTGLDRSAREALRWGDPEPAARLSNATAYALLPGLMLVDLAVRTENDGKARAWAIDAGLVAEAGGMALALDQVAKLAVGRERPFVHALAPADKARTSDPADNNLSFFSGHTSFAFAVAVSTGTIASRRRLAHAPYIWLTGTALAAFTGYLRIAADRHYLTDVLVGAAIGSAVGWAVPRLHARPSRGGLAIVPLPGSGSLGLALCGRL